MSLYALLGLTYNSKRLDYFMFASWIYYFLFSFRNEFKLDVLKYNEANLTTINFTISRNYLPHSSHNTDDLTFEPNKMDSTNWTLLLTSSSFLYVSQKYSSFEKFISRTYTTNFIIDVDYAFKAATKKSYIYWIGHLSMLFFFVIRLIFVFNTPDIVHVPRVTLDNGTLHYQFRNDIETKWWHMSYKWSEP